MIPELTYHKFTTWHPNEDFDFTSMNRLYVYKMPIVNDTRNALAKYQGHHIHKLGAMHSRPKTVYHHND